MYTYLSRRTSENIQNEPWRSFGQVPRTIEALENAKILSITDRHAQACTKFIKRTIHDRVVKLTALYESSAVGKAKPPINLSGQITSRIL